MNEFLIIDQEKINKTKNQVFNNYCAELQMIENLKNIWNQKTKKLKLKM